MILAVVGLVFTSVAAARAAASPVYLVIGSDTAIWNAGTTVDVNSRHPHYKQDSFTDPNSVSYQVMDPAFRSAFKDSYGNALKLTWWTMGGNIYRDADNINVPSANLMVLHLMKKYHGTSIAQLGDELSWHYHTYLWSDYNGDGRYYWNQSHTFHESRDDFDFTLAQYLLDENVFPVSFRSGWHYMDNEWQQELNELLPFSLHNASPLKSTATTEPLGNTLDWSEATTNFIPFHPAATNYQLAGDSAGWNVRSIKMLGLKQSDMNQVFEQAAGGTSQVACLWGHLPENFLTAITNMASFVRTASSNYPTVSFRYCTATEAMQRWLGTSDQTPPQLDVTESVTNQTVTLTLRTSEPIFQPRPFVALRDAFQHYSNITALCASAGDNMWTIVLPVPRNRLAKVGIAVTDGAGNLTTRILRYLPDDLYLDNLDPQYTELEGAWSSTTEAAWGTNARMALLTKTNPARVRWDLPITRSGVYNLSVQVPPVMNAASNVAFTVYAGNSNILSVLFPVSIPTNQWVCLGEPLLDAGFSNRVEMAVDGGNSSNTYAITDVLRVVPLADTNAPVFVGNSNLVVDCVGPGGTPVTFALGVIDAEDPHPVLSTSVASGSLFPIGLTTVVGTARDSSGNLSTCSFTVLVKDSQPPIISQPPQSLTNLVGTDATFVVFADSCGPMSYRWTRDGTTLHDQTNATLALLDVQPADGGAYAAILSNSAGSVTCLVGTLTVNHAPIAFPRGAATVKNQSIGTTVEQLIGPGYDPDGDPLAITVVGTSNNGGSVSLTSGNVLYSPRADFTGVDSFDYALNDGRGGVASSSVEVLVVSGPLPAENQVAFIPATNGFLIRFAGTPGIRYTIQRSTDLVNWTSLTAREAPVYGIVEFEDDTAPPAAAFYRMEHQ